MAFNLSLSDLFKSNLPKQERPAPKPTGKDIAQSVRASLQNK